MFRMMVLGMVPALIHDGLLKRSLAFSSARQSRSLALITVLKTPSPNAKLGQGAAWRFDDWEARHKRCTTAKRLPTHGRTDRQRN